MAEPAAPSGRQLNGSTSVLDADHEADARPTTRLDAVEAGPRNAPRGSRSRAAAIVSAIAALATVAALVIGVAAWNGERNAADGQAAADAARQVATYLTSIKADSADADLQRLLDASTGDFRDQFAQRRDPFVQIVQQAKVSTEGQVVAVGLDSLDGDTARVLAAVHSQVTNSAATQPENRDYRLSMTMQRVDGRWLASAVEFVA
ncbi:hypothetical protein [Pseudonocardia sp. NPDC049154]|uniref:hypothetical protein n=1 Tax=Pseudonocardia sp. NPDC049154 TaxID=3155501 RepID=UPI0033FF23FE